jgi:hypothetical protein
MPGFFSLLWARLLLALQQILRRAELAPIVITLLAGIVPAVIVGPTVSARVVMLISGLLEISIGSSAEAIIATVVISTIGVASGIAGRFAYALIVAPSQRIDHEVNNARLLIDKNRLDARNEGFMKKLEDRIEAGLLPPQALDYYDERLKQTKSLHREKEQ